MAKNLGINIVYEFKGCIVKSANSSEEHVKNREADKYYSLKLGKNWKKRLREKTRDQLKKQMRANTSEK